MTQPVRHYAKLFRDASNYFEHLDEAHFDEPHEEAPPIGLSLVGIAFALVASGILWCAIIGVGLWLVR